MKTYQKRPGVLLLNVCDEDILAATRKARDYCPYVTHLNASAAVFWRLLDQENTLTGLTRLAAKKLQKEEKALLFPVMTFLGKMSQNGYLIVKDEEE